MRQGRRWELFECQRCGKCCAEIGLPYDPEKIHAIAHLLAHTVDQVIEKYYGRWTCERTGWILEDHKRTPCPFLRAEGDRNVCAIYPVRPLGCRLYPFDTDGGRGGVDCPGAEIVYAKLHEED